MGCSPSGTGCSSRSPLWGYKPCQQTCSSVGCSPQGHSSCQEPAPVWAFRRVTASFRHKHLLWRGVLHGLQGDNLHHHCPHQGLQVNLSSGAWSTSFFTALFVCRAASLTFFSLLSYSCCVAFLHFLKDMITEALLKSLMGSALGSGGCVLELSGTGSIWGQPLCLLTEATLAAPLLPKSCRVNPVQMLSFFFP